MATLAVAFPACGALLPPCQPSAHVEVGGVELNDYILPPPPPAPISANVKVSADRKPPRRKSAKPHDSTNLGKRRNSDLIAAIANGEQAPAGALPKAGTYWVHDSSIKGISKEELKMIRLLDISKRISAVMEEARAGASGEDKLMSLQPARSIKDLKVVQPAQALPGRSDPLVIDETHYVLGTSLQKPCPSRMEIVVMANGCFWGSEKGFWRLPGVYSTAVGYAAGFTPNPTYEEVGTGRTGSTEAVQVVFDPNLISLVDILRWFWESHDPTQGMGQGNDVGTQYRSGLYAFNKRQRKVMEASRHAYQKALQAAGKSSITTEIRLVDEYVDKPGAVFYFAENEHQQYLAKPDANPYCSAEPLQVSLPSFEQWAPKGLEEAYAPKLDEAFWFEHAPRMGRCITGEQNAPIKWP